MDPKTDEGVQQSSGKARSLSFLATWIPKDTGRKGRCSKWLGQGGSVDGTALWRSVNPRIRNAHLHGHWTKEPDGQFTPADRGRDIHPCSAGGFAVVFAGKL